jgi:hypothetical protein
MPSKSNQRETAVVHRYRSTPAVLTEALPVARRNWPVGCRFAARSSLQSFPTGKQSQHRTKETAMFALTQITRSTQQYVCMALSALIVAASLSMGAYAAESAAHADYQVTITQIQ